MANPERATTSSIFKNRSALSIMCLHNSALMCNNVPLSAIDITNKQKNSD
ncbi:hypothetical protein HPSD74_0797 [Glaesserella parasuis D74]|nr:hypothetical protein HPSD74_0797 [Glaesserella parasuis D74]